MNRPHQEINGHSGTQADLSAQDSCWISRALSENESRLIRYVCSLVTDVNIAREIVQETFLQLCRQNRQSVEPHLVSWLFRVSRNAAIDHLRKERRMSTHLTDADPANESSGSRILESAPLPTDLLEQQETLQAVQRQVQKLSDGQREVIRLRFEHQLSYQQIAEVTGKTTTAVGFALHSAIKKLRKTLNPDPATS